jgi:hypothetical protein
MQEATTIRAGWRRRHRAVGRRRRRRLAGIPLVVSVLFLGGSAVASADVPCTGAPYMGNDLLGPDVLPTTGVIGAMLQGYNRLGGLTLPVFLDYFRDPNAQHNGMISPYWSAPPFDGFLTGLRTVPVTLPDRHRATTVTVPTPFMHPEELKPGQFFDRFGSPKGRFLAPKGTPFAERSLQPDALTTTAGEYGAVCNYHLYEVLRPFKVEEGTVAPWYKQPGFGQQIYLDSRLDQPLKKKIAEARGTFNVLWLTGHQDGGPYLKALNTGLGIPLR